MGGRARHLETRGVQVHRPDAKPGAVDSDFVTLRPGVKKRCIAKRVFTQQDVAQSEVHVLPRCP